MELPFGILMGLGLAAACGLRVFVPLLVMSIAAAAGHLQLASGFEWIGSPVAVVAFGTATAIEIAGYYIPAVDHFLDLIAAPAAATAGTIAMAASVQHMSPFMTWAIAVIAGGGAATTVQALTMVTRAASTLTTAGLGNHVVSTGEAGGSIALAGIAIAWPVLAGFLAIGLVVWTIRTGWRWLHRRGQKQYAAAAGGTLAHADPFDPTASAGVSEAIPIATPARKPAPEHQGRWIDIAPR